MKTAPAVGDRLLLRCCPSTWHPVTVVRVNPSPDPRFAPTVDVAGRVHGLDQTLTVWLADLSIR